MVDFEDGSSFVMARKLLTLAPSDVNREATGKRKIAAQDTAADGTPKRRASEPNAAQKRKIAAKLVSMVRELS